MPSREHAPFPHRHYELCHNRRHRRRNRLIVVQQTAKLAHVIGRPTCEHIADESEMLRLRRITTAMA